MAKSLNLPEPTICDMTCFFAPNHAGPCQYTPERAIWNREKMEELRKKEIERMSERNTLKIYQCGPMAGCSDEEMHGWREDLKKNYPDITWLDPCDRNYVHQQWRKLVDDDIQDINNADYVLAYYWKTGSGSAMELAYNHYVARKPSVVVVPEFKVVSPWVRYHADYLVETFDHAMKIILSTEDRKF